MKRVAIAVETAARKDLRALPELYRNSAVAKGYLLLARRLDAGVSVRDSTAALREMRLALMALYALAPAEVENSTVDELERRREQRMQGLAGGS